MSTFDESWERMEQRLNESQARMERRLDEFQASMTAQLAILQRNIDELARQTERLVPYLAAMAAETSAIERPRAFGRDVTELVPQPETPRRSNRDLNISELDDEEMGRPMRQYRQSLRRLARGRESEVWNITESLQVDENGRRNQYHSPSSPRVEHGGWRSRMHDPRTPKKYKKGDAPFVIYESPGGRT